MNGGARFKVDMLGQQTEFDSSRSHYIAAISRFFTTCQAEDCRLTRPVASHQPDMLTRIDLQSGATQDVLRAVGLMNF
jgi:hypothetical protein